MQTEEEVKKELARLRRIAAELAGQVHDLVEERLLAEYTLLTGLAAALVAACEEYHAFRRGKGS